MFSANLVRTAFEDLIGWRQHYNAADFQILESLTQSQTNEYYNTHPAMDLAVIKSALKPGEELDAYLARKLDDGIITTLNDFITKRQAEKYAPTLLRKTQLMNGVNFLTDLIPNLNRFVGFAIRLKVSEGLQMLINEIGLQFNEDVEIPFYLFHSDGGDPIMFNLNAQANKWNWSEVTRALNSVVNAGPNGGVYYLGYYQEDLGTASAIRYNDFNFNTGACGSCNPLYGEYWRSITEYYEIMPFYVGPGDFTKGQLFDASDMVATPTTNYGLNLKMSVQCDLTNFFIQNRLQFKEALKTRVLIDVLTDIKFSPEIGSVTEQIKMWVVRELEGDTETKAPTALNRYFAAIKSLKFNLSGINQACLQCEDEAAPFSYGVA